MCILNKIKCLFNNMYTIVCYSYPVFNTRV